MKFGWLFVAALPLIAAPHMPQLAQRGQYAVGVRTLNLVHQGQVDILHFDAATGKAPLYDRPLYG